MDATALLILPLVGGYVFAYCWHGSRYLIAREEGHRLYFRAAFYAVWLFTVAAIIRYGLVAEFSFYEEFEEQLRHELARSFKSEAGADAPVLALICTGAFLLGVIGWWPLNVITGERRWLKYAINTDGGMEALFYRATEINLPVALTMKNRKVYVGFVRKTPEPRPVGARVVWVQPLMSGYRDDAGEVQFTTFYDQVYEELWSASPEEEFALEDFEIVLPTDSIESAGLFETDVYQRFLRLRPDPQTSEESERERKRWRRGRL